MQTGYEEENSSEANRSGVQNPTNSVRQEGMNGTASAEESINVHSGHRVVQCDSECIVDFNVMPDRKVREMLKIKEFRIGSNWVEAEFDRTYSSSMVNSPSHLTFVSALVQMQKITYVYSCHRFGFDPNVREPESLKVWPTALSILMRELVRDEERLIHRMDFTSYRKIENRRYLASAKTTIGPLQIDGSAMILLLRDPCQPE